MSRKTSKTQRNKAITAAAVASDPFSELADNDALRIRRVSADYKDVPLAEAFARYYKMPVEKESRQNRLMNEVTRIEPGSIYFGAVKRYDKDGIEFGIPGVKEELVCKEAFASPDAMRNFILGNNGRLMFEVREKKRDKYLVSVISAYYKLWYKGIEKAVFEERPIKVHIDGLVKGGFLAHTVIDTLTRMTGAEYTNSVFVPGSQIVLNIERDFEKWIGQDVEAVPQKIVDFRRDWRTGNVEKSIVCSRKRYLMSEGFENMMDIYKRMNFVSKMKGAASLWDNPAMEGVVTGIINSAAKRAVFVEVPEKCFTGIVSVTDGSLLDYKPGDKVRVRIARFETAEGKEPFIVRKNRVVRCNTRIVFDFA